MNLFRITAVCLNVIQFAFLVWLLNDQGWPYEADEQLMVLLYCATPAVNLAYFAWSVRGEFGGSGLLALEIEARKLRLRAEIKAHEAKLKSEMGSK